MNLKKINYRHYICIVITITFALLTIFYFTLAHKRIYESFFDIISSILFYFKELFNLKYEVNPTVNEFSKVSVLMPINLPKKFEDFKNILVIYGKMLFEKENYLNYCAFLKKYLEKICYITLLILPFIMSFIIIYSLRDNVNNDYNEDTKALKFWKKYVENKFYYPLKKWMIEFINFIKDNKIYLIVWILLWGYSFNLITIIIEFIAYYLFIIACFDMTSIYTQLIKLLLDLDVMVKFIPKFIWVSLIIYILDIYRKRIGYIRLNHMELKNRGYINDRPICFMMNGTMGSYKTTVVADATISLDIILRNKAFELIQENDLKFPFFPWINLENDFKKAIDNHSVYNLATARRYAYSKKRKFEKHKHKRHIFMYDYEKYGMYYDNNLSISSIWDVIESYVQEYFIYIIESSLVIGNFSVRTDIVMNDLGNFPLWNFDLFKKDTKDMDKNSKYSHILDFDMLRLGKKVIEENKKADCFEFGVIDITEVGKERGNSIELQSIKKSDLSANQKNDLFNSWLKMVRHSATVDNYPFVKVITDDQRPESWGADARDLCEIIFSEKTKDVGLAMPFFILEDLVINFVIDKFLDKYYNFRFERGDNTLLMYLFHGLASKLKKYYVRIYNTFGYRKLNTTIESGRQDGKIKESKYYLMFKKIYSKRFSTDCFSGLFNEKALRSKIGINDLESFKSVKATFEEMEKEHSYFFDDLTNIMKK